MPLFFVRGNFRSSESNAIIAYEHCRVVTKVTKRTLGKPPPQKPPYSKKGGRLYSINPLTLYSINPLKRIKMIEYKGQLNEGNDALGSERTITANV